MVGSAPKRADNRSMGRLKFTKLEMKVQTADENMLLSRISIYSAEAPGEIVFC